jgi:hypothetical protein
MFSKSNKPTKIASKMYKLEIYKEKNIDNNNDDEKKTRDTFTNDKPHIKNNIIVNDDDYHLNNNYVSSENSSENSSDNNNNNEIVKIDKARVNNLAFNKKFERYKSRFSCDIPTFCFCFVISIVSTAVVTMIIVSV